MFWDLQHPSQRTAVVREDLSTINYGELTRLADAFATSVGSGKKLVFILCGNNLESLVGYLGCLRSGHVPLLLDEAINPDLLAELCDLYHPEFVWRRGTGVTVFVLGAYALEQTGAASPELHPELALLLSTSGSTGSPKLVRLSYRNLESNAESIVSYLELTPEERAITVLPMGYTYGLSVINSHLLCGATLLLTSQPIIQKEFWAFFKAAQGTSLVGVPYTYAMYRRAGLFKMELPSLRYMTQAGGKLSAEEVTLFAEWCRGRGVKLFVMYGQTEATARMSYLPPDQCLSKSASVGVAIPNGRFAIVDEERREISEPEVVGELIYYGPNVSMGYAQRDEELALGDINGGRLATGDMAKRDSDGYVYITGRLKRFIKIAGLRIGLDDVERALKNAGIESVCGGKDDLLCVAVPQASDIPRLRDALMSNFKFHHSQYKVVVVPIENLPRNSSGKIQYRELFKDFL